MNSSQFKRNEVKKFCAIIGFKPQKVQSIIENIDVYYYERSEPKLDVKTGEFKKYKDGTIKQRVIRPSRNELKILQSRIKDRILAPIQLPTNIHGGIKKKDNITNAKRHQGNKYQFTTDLRDFYPNISFKQVYQSLLNVGFSTHFSHILTQLTTWKYALPQGTPTSNHLANLVFLPTDRQLIELCLQNGITYTRYVDDLTFSSQQDFRPLLNEILEIVRSNNFSINYRKTQYQGNQTITGIDVFLNKIDAPKHIIEKAKQNPSTESFANPIEN